MERPVYYCRQWFRAKKRALEPYSSEQALGLYRKQECIAALIDSAQNPSCFLEITPGCITVEFLDQALRSYLVYSFHDTEDGQLFLSMATYREFDGESDRVSMGTVYVFKQDGHTNIERHIFGEDGSVQIEESQSTFDPVGHYDRKPDFGDYDHLIRIDRI